MTVVGVIGAGRWGGNWLRTLSSLSGVHLKWCCDLEPASLERVRGQFPPVRTTTSVDEMLADDEMEGVVVASIAPTHFEVARRCLLAGKHVLVEKPMTLTTGHALELNALAQRAGRTLMVGHLLDYHPIVRHIKGMIEAGDLGDVFFLYSQRLNLGTIRSDENAWWSLAPHDISVACRLLGGMPVSVQCRGQNIIDPRIADVVFSTLAFPGGRLAQFHVSWLDPHKSRKLTVVGGKKSLVFDDTAEHKLVIYDRGFDRLPGRTGAAGVTLRLGDVAYPRLAGPEPLAAEAQHFVDCIRTGLAPYSDGAAGAMVVTVLEHGQQSLDNGGAVVPISPQEDALHRAA